MLVAVKTLSKLILKAVCENFNENRCNVLGKSYSKNGENSCGKSCVCYPCCSS